MYEYHINCVSTYSAMHDNALYMKNVPVALLLK